MQPNKVFWTTPKKIIFTIILAVIASYLFGCNRPEADDSNDGLVTEAYLHTAFNHINNTYFDRKLPIPEIKLDATDGKFVAYTQCSDDGKTCSIHFNPKYVVAESTADPVLLHEACHMKTWTQTVTADMPSEPTQAFFHGKPWKDCMYQVEADGAFRDLLIDSVGGQ